jgi:hypothetical protein
LVVTFVGAWLIQFFDARILKKLEAMSASSVVDYEKHLHSHSYFFTFFALLISGGVYLGVIEALRGLFGKLASPKKNA